MINGNEPAFSKAAFYDRTSGCYDRSQEGLSKREYFAALAMQGLLSNPGQIDTTDFEWVATHAVGYTDALIEQLNN